ncbi:hypothetical protein JVT61DRAFT_3950 [Boletus reticuloceps]|uniref:Uncharacterized protein n=1 Tax=Boletus reticuloceps TaxID=495285 RepID=A0A8I2YMN0_9AGAM|nr:hypothetical protein JVT61DRAFT_3950 [Boletus reticuloceps]
MNSNSTCVHVLSFNPQLFPSHWLSLPYLPQLFQYSLYILIYYPRRLLCCVPMKIYSFSLVLQLLHPWLHYNLNLRNGTHQQFLGPLPITPQTLKLLGLHQ